MRRVMLVSVTLAVISLLSIISQFYVAKGVICVYVKILPYLLPLAYLLGLFTALLFEEKEPCREKMYRLLRRIFRGDEMTAVEIALREGTQAELAGKIGKVRASRVVKKLESMGIIRRKKKNQTYVLKVNFPDDEIRLDRR